MSSAPRQRLCKLLQFGFVAAKTRHHGRKHRFGIEASQFERMAGALSQQNQQGKLCTPVSLAERMNGVQLAQKVRYLLSKFAKARSSKIPVVSQRAEQLSHFAINMFWIAEHAAVFGYAHRSDCTGPGTNVLKEVPVDGAIVRIAQSTRRKCFGGPLRCNFRLESIEPCLISQTQLVDEDGCTRITLRIGNRIIHWRPL